MKYSLVVLCVCCVLCFNNAEGKRGGGYSSRGKSKSRDSSSHNRYKPPPPPPPPPIASPKKPEVNKFLDAERHQTQNNRFPNPAGNQNPAPIGFDNVNRGTGTNNRPIGFESFNNKPNSGKIGFDNVNPGNKPSAPVLPGNYNPGQSNPQFGQPHSGQSYPGQQFPNQNIGHYPNQQNPGSNFGYPGQTNPGHGYPTNQNFGNPYGGGQQGFGQNYPNNYPHQSYGNSYQGQPHFGSNQGYGGYGSPYGGGFGSGGFGGGGYGGGGFFGSNQGFGGGYNNYGQKSRFGFGGMPIPIPIPIPIPFGGFGFGNSYNSHHSHRALNDVVQQASKDSNNATSVYIINNNTVLPCTREHFKYELYNVSITTCTILNCSAVSLTTVKNVNGKVETNFGSVTMCLDPTATISVNSTGSGFPTISDVKTYWKSVCELTKTSRDFNNSQINSTNSMNTGNLTENTNTLKTEQNITMPKETEEIKTTTEVQSEITTVPVTSKPNITTELINQINNTNSNLTTFYNVTAKPCQILNCSSVEFCMPKVQITCDDAIGNLCNYSSSTYISCIELKMCSSPNSLLIDREVKLNTKKNVVEKDNSIFNQTLKENVTVIAYIPPNPAFLQNTTGAFQGGNTSISPSSAPGIETPL